MLTLRQDRSVHGSANLCGLDWTYMEAFVENTRHDREQDRHVSQLQVLNFLVKRGTAGRGGRKAAQGFCCTSRYWSTTRRLTVTFLSYFGLVVMRMRVALPETASSAFLVCALPWKVGADHVQILPVIFFVEEYILIMAIVNSQAPASYMLCFIRCWSDDCELYIVAFYE